MDDKKLRTAGYVYADLDEIKEQLTKEGIEPVSIKDATTNEDTVVNNLKELVKYTIRQLKLNHALNVCKTLGKNTLIYPFNRDKNGKQLKTKLGVEVVGSGKNKQFTVYNRKIARNQVRNEVGNRHMNMVWNTNKRNEVLEKLEKQGLI